MEESSKEDESTIRNENGRSNRKRRRSNIYKAYVHTKITMAEIVTKGEENYYVGSRGDETLVQDLDDNHLQNAYNKAMREDGDENLITILGEELQKRTNQNTNES